MIRSFWVDMFGGRKGSWNIPRTYVDILASRVHASDFNPGSVTFVGKRETTI